MTGAEAGGAQEHAMGVGAGGGAGASKWSRNRRGVGALLRVGEWE